MSHDPYGAPEKKPGLYDTVLGGLRTFNSGMSIALGIVFGLIGVAALIAALVTRESYFLPLGLTALAIGAIRFFLGRRR